MVKAKDRLRIVKMAAEKPVVQVQANNEGGEEAKP